MSYRHLLIAAMLVGVTALVGCSHKGKMGMGSSSKMDAQAQAAKMEADRANQRLDNMSRGWKK